MLQPYPCPQADNSDEQALSDAEWLKAVITAIRNIRGEMNVPPSKALSVILKNLSDDDQRRLQANRQFLVKLAKLDDIQLLAAGDQAPMSATQLIGDMELLVPMAGLIDKAAELGRLDKEIAKLDKDIQRLAGKLNNPGFVDKAPAAVVDKEKEKLQAQQHSRHRLVEQREAIDAL